MDQQLALAILHSGKNVLLTGAAGSGKTFVLQQFIKEAREKGLSVAVTATTGLAATHISGSTIHSWSGIGIHDSITPQQISAFSKSRQDAIKKADVLVIDEISMLHDFRLDMIDTVLRTVRDNNEVFGGVQVVLCGDFFQLPPINRQGSRQGGFVVNSLSWQRGNFVVCYLEGTQRQKDDAKFAEFLQSIRLGDVTEVQYEDLKDRMFSFVDPFENITKLYTTNVDVDTINNKQLQNINSRGYTYRMETTGKKQYVETLKKSCLASEELTLKIDALVMCIKNAQDKKYVNGSIGVVVGFAAHTNYPIVQLKNGEEITVKPDTWELTDGETRRAQLVQIPLRLAWAITVHKSQGMTLDAAEIDLTRAFTPGMGYVALSRVRSMKNIYLKGINNVALLVSEEAMAIDDFLQRQSQQAMTRHKNTDL